MRSSAAAAKSSRAPEYPRSTPAGTEWTHADAVRVIAQDREHLDLPRQPTLNGSLILLVCVFVRFVWLAADERLSAVLRAALDPHRRALARALGSAICSRVL